MILFGAIMEVYSKQIRYSHNITCDSFRSTCRLTQQLAKQQQQKLMGNSYKDNIRQVRIRILDINCVYADDATLAAVTTM